MSETIEYLTLPSPLAKSHADGWITPSQALARYLVDNRPAYHSDGPMVIRERATDWPGKSVWVVVALGSGQIRATTDAISISKSSQNEAQVTLRFDNGPMQPDWLTLEPGNGIGWRLTDWLDVSEDIGDSFDDEGYPRICEAHTLTDADHGYLERLEQAMESETGAEIVDAIEPAPANFPWAEIWADGEYLCDTHWTDKFGPVVYLTSHDRDYPNGLADYRAEIEALVRQSTFALQSRALVPSIHPTRADWFSWTMATGRLSIVAERAYKSAQNRYLESVVAGYESQYLTRDETIERGVSETYLDITDERERVRR